MVGLASCLQTKEGLDSAIPWTLYKYFLFLWLHKKLSPILHIIDNSITYLLGHVILESAYGPYEPLLKKYPHKF